MKHVMQWLMIAFLVCVFAHPCFSGEKQVTLASLNWAPYAGESLENYGFTSEIITRAFERSGYKVSIVFKPWKRVLHEVEKGKFDALYCAYYTDERAKVFGFSDAYGTGVVGFFKQKGTPIAYKALEDLTPYNIGITLGYANAKAFDAADFLKKETSSTDLVSLKKLASGRVDLAVLDKFTGLHILNTQMQESRDKIEFMEPPLAVNDLFVCFSKARPGWEKKRADFNSGLKAIRADSTYDTILKNHGF